MGSLGSALPSAVSSPIFRRRSPRLLRTYTFGGSFLPDASFVCVALSLFLVVGRAGVLESNACFLSVLFRVPLSGDCFLVNSVFTGEEESR